MAFASNQTWPVRLVSSADLEGPPVVVTGTDEAFALHGNDGEEVATEPLERINLASGDVVSGPRVPDDALLGVVGRRVVLVAPANYDASGIATRPWIIWTVNPVTLQFEHPDPLAFVSSFGVVIPAVDAAPAAFELWVSNGTALRLVDLATGKVVRSIRVPALELSIDPTGRRLYALTGTGGMSATGSPYRTGTIVELDARTGTLVASSSRWTTTPQLQIAASAAGVFLMSTGQAKRPEVFLNAQSLSSTTLPTGLESIIETSLQRQDGVTTTSVEHGAVIGSAGHLTCITPEASSVRASTALAPGEASWTVFAQQGEMLFAWDIPSTAESSRIEAIVSPTLC